MKSIFTVVVTLTFAIFAIFATFAQAGQAGQASSNNAYDEDKKAISAVVKKFEQAIIDKDKPGFMALFVEENVSWIGVYDEETVEYRRKLIAAMAKEKQVPLTRLLHSSPSEFIDFIIKSESGNRETFENVRITTDGKVASVYFNYELYDGDYKSHWGDEAWQLVKTMNGWRINSVIFSMTFNPEPNKTKQ